jgi:hypothetical protein
LSTDATNSGMYIRASWLYQMCNGEMANTNSAPRATGFDVNLRASPYVSGRLIIPNSALGSRKNVSESWTCKKT